MVRVIVVVGLLVVAAGQYLYKVKIYQQLRPGDVVRVQGVATGEPLERLGRHEIALPSEINVEFMDRIDVTGKVLSRVTEDHNKQIRLKYQSINKIDKAAGLIRQIGRIRQVVWEYWQSWLPGDRGKLVAGIIVGGSGTLSQASQLALRQVGLTHVIAASGYNLSVIASMVGAGLAMKVGRRWGGGLTVLAIVGYMVLAGLNPPIVRAGIMSMGLVMGKACGRKGSGMWWLILSALVMWVCDAEIVEGISWQLSVAATVGVMWLKPNWFGRLGELGTTLGAIVMTMPIIWYNFGQISWIAPVANMLVGSVVPYIMELGVVVTAIGLIVPRVGQLIAYVVWPGATWILQVAHNLARVFGGQWQVPKLEMMGVIGSYMAIGLSVWIKKKFIDTR